MEKEYKFTISAKVVRVLLVQVSKVSHSHPGEEPFDQFELHKEAKRKASSVSECLWSVSLLHTFTDAFLEEPSLMRLVPTQCISLFPYVSVGNNSSNNRGTASFTSTH